MGVIALALTVALALVGKTGATFDAKAKTLSARGAAAADLRAPSAQIARVKAERAARAQAEKKLAAAIGELRFDGDADELAKKAAIASEDYGSDGSVELVLTLDVSDLQRRK